ncbi:RidA family protein [Tanticharoenia sakaeratensis]|jgi:enamine deaminase RidA (YjgF/YER057c/UK114 family)|uniref:Endoribonuclease L-PSP n=1 Tax=Tanticharoenia sakaeratensis NBRC 103193 TaxID=1231623 RepID=A0A0D6MKV5_9PROT|nr:RidA family protein [Tanticharoenia sakaeratensis]GAN54252.1 endoribonuclease L-PSP [Tanticharoenia sakaeratensis NBRC 103193]GBQ19153.1 endoribonuclease L-PSP [Tanticharoenia sakaeratensis NBRC 103193]
MTFDAGRAGIILAGIAAFVPGAASAADPVTRSVDPTHRFPIATAVEIPAGYSTIVISGTGAQVVNKSADPATPVAYGDTETQTRSALERIQDELGKLQLSMSDIVSMHVYLAADPKLGHSDYAGMMRAYGQFFGTKAQPNLPARSAMQVAALVNPGWLVEIEVTAARPPRM